MPDDQLKVNDVAVQATIDAVKVQAGMSKDIQYLVKGFDSLNQKVDNLPNTYVVLRDFNGLSEDVGGLGRKVETLQKIVWTAIGGLAVLNIALKFFIK